MNNGNRDFGTLGRKRKENPGCENEEKESDENKHERVHFD